MGPHGEGEKISEPGGILTHDLQTEQTIVALPTELP